MASKILKSPSPPSAEAGTILLETDRLMIRRYALTDAPVMAAAANYPEVVLNLRDRFPSPYTVADAEAFLSRPIQPGKEHYPGDNGLWIKPNTAENPSTEPLFIGAIGMIPKEDVHYRTWELGYWLTPTAWGKGFMPEAVRAFVPWSFETYPALYRVEADCYARNEQSAAVLRKCGFVEEGRKRGAAEKLGILLDLLSFSIIRTDLARS